jgi:hypothetical protein
MCFFSAPQQPNIVTQGPSADDIKRNEESLNTYKKQVADQQSAFQKQLQDQIDAANSETTKLQQQYQADAAAAAAASAAQQNGAYAATTAQATPAAGAETTTAPVKKAKPSANLKISLAGVPSSSGSGLNIGV